MHGEPRCRLPSRPWYGEARSQTARQAPWTRAEPEFDAMERGHDHSYLDRRPVSRRRRRAWGEDCYAAWSMSAAPADEPVGRLNRDRLLSLLAMIGNETGLDVRDAELVKFTNNAVFRLPHEGVVARIAGSLVVRQRVPKVVMVARWLATHDLPAVRLLPDLPQPLTVDGELVTLWYEVPRAGPPPTGTELGHLLRRIHALPAPVDLPAWNPLDGIRTRLADAEDLTDGDHAFFT